MHAATSLPCVSMVAVYVWQAAFASCAALLLLANARTAHVCGTPACSWISRMRHQSCRLPALEGWCCQTHATSIFGCGLSLRHMCARLRRHVQDAPYVRHMRLACRDNKRVPADAYVPMGCSIFVRPCVHAYEVYALKACTRRAYGFGDDDTADKPRGRAALRDALR